jgi:chitin synthase
VDGWEKVVVCIIADGREKINKNVLDMLSVLGVYQEGIAKSSVNNDPVHAHLYEVRLLFILFLISIS